MKEKKEDIQKESLITEYLETYEGQGISIIPLKEQEKNIDSEKRLIVDQKLEKL